MTQRIEISSKTIIFTVLFLLGLKVFWMIRELIFTLTLAFIFMSALKPTVNKMVRHGIPRVFAAFMVLMSAIVCLVFVLAFILPPIISESISFLTNLPLILVDAFPVLSRTLTPESALRFFPDITQNVFKIASGVFSNIFFVVSVVFFTFYFLLEETFLQKFLQKFMTHDEARTIVDIMQKIEIRLGAWMRGQFILMLIIGVMSYIGLTILGIRYALSLAFIAGLLEVIPIIGPVVSSIPAFLVASATSLFTGGITLVLYIIIQQLENNLIVPFVMNRAAGINPIMTLIALSIGGKLGGFLGAILAVPIAVAIETIASEFLNTRRTR